MTYFDVNLDLTTKDKMIRDATHKFAKEVMRPSGIAIDRLSAEEAVAPRRRCGCSSARATAWVTTRPCFPKPPADSVSRLCKRTS